ncbi:MAG: alpha/beta hydrolase [Opitutia bacterium]
MSRPGLQLHALAAAAPAARMPLWDGAPPAETLTVRPGADPAGIPDKSGHLTHVHAPDLEPFPAAKPGASLVLVFPGGGYNVLAHDHEGVGVARRLNALGYAAAVVRYRVPRRDPERPWVAPLHDARRALEVARARAAEWNADPSRIAAVGFSAGGNLVARLAYQPSDSPVPRPDAVILVYPAYLGAQEKSGPLRDGPEGVVPARGSRPAPACFFHSADDPYPAQGSVDLAAALRLAGGKAETHVFADGGHGWGVRGATRASRQWPELAAAWLESSGLPPAR